MTSEAFCSNGMRDRKEQNSAITVFLFKSFSLKTLIAFVSLFKINSHQHSQGHSGHVDWKETNNQRQSVSGDRNASR